MMLGTTNIKFFSPCLYIYCFFMICKELYTFGFFFSKFNVNRLFLHHSEISFITCLSMFSKSVSEELEIITPVSSANSIGVANLFNLYARSMI